MCIKTLKNDSALGSDNVIAELLKLTDDYNLSSFLDSLNEVYTKLIQQRLEEALHKANILSTYQSGFRKNHSTHSNITALRCIIEDAASHNHPLHTQYVDIQKAFDSKSYLQNPSTVWSGGSSR
ncbi:Reverse transcriptase domain-containing protein [Balamuthia mandrillaris]